MRLANWKRVKVSQYTSSSVRIHMCKSKCLRLSTGAPWHVCNRQIHEHGSSSLVDLAIAGASPCSPLLSRRATGSNLGQNICRVAVLGVPRISKFWVNARSQGCDVVGKQWSTQILVYYIICY